MTKKEAFAYLIEQAKQYGDAIIDAKLVEDKHPLQILEAVLMSYYTATMQASESLNTKKDFKDNVIPFNVDDTTKKTFH